MQLLRRYRAQLMPAHSPNVRTVENVAKKNGKNESSTRGVGTSKMRQEPQKLLPLLAFYIKFSQHLKVLYRIIMLRGILRADLKNLSIVLDRIILLVICLERFS